MPLSYEEIESAFDLPFWMVEAFESPWETYTFKSKSGEDTMCSIPYPVESCSNNLVFLKKHNLCTVGDFLSFFNTLGYSEVFANMIAHRGVEFDYTTWKWGAPGQDLSARLIQTYCQNHTSWLGDLFPNLDKKLHFYDFGASSGLCCKMKFKKKVGADIPTWLTEKQHYKFTPKEFEFKKLPRESAPIYLGLEFEVQSDLSMNQLQVVVTQVEPKQEPFFYFKHDGTIEHGDYDDTYEIVTQPCSPRYLKKNLSILFEKLERLNLLEKFGTDSSCGVHIHVDSNTFMSNLHKKKFITVFNQYDSRNKEFVQKLGKRLFNHYCKNNIDLEGLTLARRLKKGVKAIGHCEAKYSSCRETVSTVEVRIFKGEFSLDHIKYCIDVVLSMVDYCDKLPLRLIGSPMFVQNYKAWLRGSKYNMLKKELC